jgi:hypothetical protein
MLVWMPFRVQIMKVLFPIMMRWKKSADAQFLVNYRRDLSSENSDSPRGNRNTNYNIGIVDL